MMNTSHLQYSQMTVCKTFFKQFELQIKQHDINNPDILRKYWWKER